MQKTQNDRRERDPGTLINFPQDLTAELIERLAKESATVLVKKLSPNDRQWAIWDDIKCRWKNNQAGPLLPALARTSNFFPVLQQDLDNPSNFAVSVLVHWPVIGKLYRSRFAWFSGKGPAENHLTTNPRSEFRNIAPASFLLIFKPKTIEEPYQALTVDAEDEDLLEYIKEVFSIDIDFGFGIFDSFSLDFAPAITELRNLIDTLILKVDSGANEFDRFVSSLVRRSPQEIARCALDKWKIKNKAGHLNPFMYDMPGDILYELTREIEFSLYKQDESKSYGAQLVRALIDPQQPFNRRSIITSLIQRFDVFYDICKSAKQARVSRAGGSFETHMTSMLRDGGIPHVPQAVFDGSRPDFILPSREIYQNVCTRQSEAIVLTLKTTLRERWKQIVSESTGCPIFLATLDESVPGSTLEKLASRGIILVVPERFKYSPYSEYSGRDTVLSYRTFFDRLMDAKCESWLAAGVSCFGIDI